jgi:hypothetical protein
MDAVHKALDAMAKDQRTRAVQSAFDAAESAHGMRLAKKDLAAKLLSH